MTAIGGGERSGRFGRRRYYSDRTIYDHDCARTRHTFAVCKRSACVRSANQKIARGRKNNFIPNPRRYCRCFASLLGKADPRQGRMGNGAQTKGQTSTRKSRHKLEAEQRSPQHLADRALYLGHLNFRFLHGVRVFSLSEYFCAQTAFKSA